MPGKYKEPLTLASQSPRRRELIRLIFSKIDAITASDSEPKWSPGERPREYLQACIDAKWQTALTLVDPAQTAKGRGLLVADTVVVLGQDILGKPESPEEAHSMLGRLSGREHRVWTAVRLGRFRGQSLQWKQGVVESRVQFRDLSESEIRHYVEVEKPFDKAGAYGFQDRALLFVDRVEGSYTNIIGLPIEEVRRLAGTLSFV